MLWYIKLPTQTVAIPDDETRQSYVSVALIKLDGLWPGRLVGNTTLAAVNRRLISAREAKAAPWAVRKAINVANSMQSACERATKHHHHLKEEEEEEEEEGDG